MYSDKVSKYAQSVVTGELPSCRYVKLACERHLSDMSRIGDDDFPYTFSEPHAERFFKFCTYLKHYKGECSGKSFKLEPWQEFVFGSIYGWLNKSKHWRFHYVYLEVPRKNGKTTMAAAGAAFDCAMVENTGAEVYCVATKEDQAKLLYNDVLAYIHQSEELQEMFEVLQGRSTLYARETSRTSFIKPLGADSKRHDGLNPVSVYADELHAWPKRELWDVMEDAFGARKQYHMIAITTAGHDKNGICFEERKHLVEILEGNIKSEDKFGIIYTVDKENQDNWSAEEVWRAANPNLGVGKNVEYMLSQCQKVSQMPSKLNTFLNKQLNIWTDVAQAWLRSEDWLSGSKQFNDTDLIGKMCYAGIDLARVNDLSAVAYYFPAQDGLEKPHTFVDFFLPEENIDAKATKDRVPYRVWQREGHLNLTAGKTTDWDFIRHSVLKRNGQFAIQGVGYDRHFAGELVSSLEKEKVKMKPFGMGYLSMATPTSELERLCVASNIIHNNNPVLNWCANNVVVSQDAAGNLKPDKLKSEQKIDGIVALIIALGISISDNTESSNPYKERGLRVI
tara:strand:- start:1972 stop:3663 length:1692 start_codon:yes stop_codon:yes gene_type:complete